MFTVTSLASPVPKLNQRWNNVVVLKVIGYTQLSKVKSPVPKELTAAVGALSQPLLGKYALAPLIAGL